MRQKAQMKLIRHARIRRRVIGSSERPRLCVFRSNKNIYAQVIDDSAGRTLCSASTLQESIKGQAGGKKPVEAAKLVGTLLGEQAKSAGISKVVFDRGGCKYHGRVQALAEGAREAGLEF